MHIRPDIDFPNTQWPLDDLLYMRCVPCSPVGSQAWRMRGVAILGSTCPWAWGGLDSSFGSTIPTLACDQCPGYSKSDRDADSSSLGIHLQRKIGKADTKRTGLWKKPLNLLLSSYKNNSCTL